MTHKYCFKYIQLILEYCHVRGRVGKMKVWRYKRNKHKP